MNKMSKEEIASLDLAKSRDVETSIRTRLHEIRMDIFNEKKTSLGEVRKLKKQLARVLTFRHAMASTKK